MSDEKPPLESEGISVKGEKDDALYTVKSLPLTEEQIHEYCLWMWEKFGKESAVPRAFIIILDVEGGPQAFSNVALAEQKLDIIRPVVKDLLHDKFMHDVLKDTLKRGRKILEEVGLLKKPN